MIYVERVCAGCGLNYLTPADEEEACCWFCQEDQQRRPPREPYKPYVVSATRRKIIPPRTGIPTVRFAGRRTVSRSRWRERAVYRMEGSR